MNLQSTYWSKLAAPVVRMSAPKMHMHLKSVRLEHCHGADHTELNSTNLDWAKQLVTKDHWVWGSMKIPPHGASVLQKVKSQPRPSEEEVSHCEHAPSKRDTENHRSVILPKNLKKKLSMIIFSKDCIHKRAILLLFFFTLLLKVLSTWQHHIFSSLWCDLLPEWGFEQKYEEKCSNKVYWLSIHEVRCTWCAKASIKCPENTDHNTSAGEEETTSVVPSEELSWFWHYWLWKHVCFWMTLMIAADAQFETLMKYFWTSKYFWMTECIALKLERSHFVSVWGVWNFNCSLQAWTWDKKHVLHISCHLSILSAVGSK